MVGTVLGCGFREAPIPSLLELTLVFAAGALVTAGLVALARWWLTLLLEPRGQRLDLWRRPWFHPERELGFFLEALLILAFLVAFARRYGFPAWMIGGLFVLWALHLLSDAWTWLRVRLRPQGTLALHQRGFFLLDAGPLWLRALAGLLAAGLYFLVPPLRGAFDFFFGFLLASLHDWFS